MAKILIVDDEKPILRMYSEALTGHDIILAENGDEGLKMASKEQPDIILLDIIMPQVNGLDVLEKLKNDRDTSGIPVIILTNLPEEASADKAKALGAVAYYVKAQYDPEKLAEIVNKTLGKK